VVGFWCFVEVFRELVCLVECVLGGWRIWYVGCGGVRHMCGIAECL